jgi:hypothetical protein
MTATGSAERQRVSGFGRLDLGLRQASDWYLWRPHLSERQWGTVREDYSADGDAFRRDVHGVVVLPYPKRVDENLALLVR